MRRTVALLLSGLVVTTGLVGIAAPARAAAHTAVAVPLDSFRDIVVDDAHGHVFLTGGGSNGVVVRTLTGAAVTTITNQPGASQMALSEDGGTLFVALVNGDAISAISTVTLTETARFPTGASTCPASVAVTQGKVWFGYGCDGFGHIGVLDPQAVPPVTLAKMSMFPYGVPTLQSSPALPGRLVAGQTGSPSLVKTFDVSSGDVVAGATAETGSNLQDVAISEDGTHVVTASGAPYHHPAYRITDLSADGVYGQENAYPTAVALGADLVVAGVNGIYGLDIYVYRTAGTLIRDYEIGGYANEAGGLNAAGLALSADASRLYAVTGGNAHGGPVRLHVLHDPGKSRSAISLTAPTGTSINRAFAVTGRLTSSVAIPAGAVIQVQRDSSYGTVTLPARTTGADGRFTITDTVNRRGTYGYRATWAGDATRAGTTKRVTVSVAGLATALTITTSAGPYSYGAKPRIVAHLGKTKARTVKIYATPYGGSRQLIKQGTVDASGNLAVYYTVTKRTTFQAAFAGDDTYSPRNSYKALLARARVVTAVHGHYSASGGYKLFRLSADPSLLVSVSPNNANTCMRYVAQRYISGAWRDVATASCEPLDSTSRGGATYYSNPSAGTKFRTRATFMGNYRNVATHGVWVYGKFTR